ncbi:MAG: hypothetical protein ACR2JB_11040 [Bryobacteraceae bacterium]
MQRDGCDKKAGRCGKVLAEFINKAAGYLHDHGGTVILVSDLDQALQLAYVIRAQRNRALQNATTTWYKSCYPRVLEAKGRYLLVLNSVQDYRGDRTLGLKYLIQREFLLALGDWSTQLQQVRIIMRRRINCLKRPSTSISRMTPRHPSEARIKYGRRLRFNPNSEAYDSRRDLILYGLVILTPTAP